MNATPWLTKFRNRLHGKKTQPHRRHPSALSLFVEQLEDRITPDVSKDFLNFTITAIGPTAKFNEYGPSAPGVVVLRPDKAFVTDTNRIFTTESLFPVEVSVKGSSPKQVLFTLPEGGYFRLGRANTSATSAIVYADFVPRYGVITVPNGIAANGTVAQQQTVTVPGTTGAFTLSWGGQTTAALKAGVTADDVQLALNQLSSIDGAGGAVVVSKKDAAYTVTFGGSIASKPALITVSGTGITGTASVAPVTQVAVTKRLPNARFNGFESAIYTLQTNKSSLDVVLGTQSTTSTAFITIPAEQATAFPTIQSATFTPSAFGFYPTVVSNVDAANKYKADTIWETRLLGSAELPTALSGSITAGSISEQRPFTQKTGGETSSAGFSRFVKSSQGFSLVIPNVPAKPEFTLNSVGVDVNKNPRPITFQFGGLEFTIPAGAYSLNFDGSSNSLSLPSGKTLDATAAFAGGTLTLRFSSFKLDLTANTVTAATMPTFISLKLGEFIIPATDAFKMAYDSATQKFTFTINNLTLDSSVSITSLFSRTFTISNLGTAFYLTVGGSNLFTRLIGPNPTLQVMQEALNASGIPATATLASGGGYLLTTTASAGIVDMVQHVRFYNSFNGDEEFTDDYLAPGYTGDAVNPMKVTIPAGTISLTKGTLDTIAGLSVSSFQMGRIIPVIHPAPNFFSGPSITYDPTYLPKFESLPTDGLKLRYTTATVYNADGSVRIPTDSFGIYGKAKTPLTIPGITIPDTADLNTPDNPGMIITDSAVRTLNFAVAQMKVGAMTFTSQTVNGSQPLTASYFPQPIGVLPAYAITGGAKMTPGGTVIQSDMSVNFGGNGTTGVQIYSNENRFTMSFGVVGAFVAGKNTIEASAGPDGMKVIYNPADTTYTLAGKGYLDFAPTAPLSKTAPKMTGTKMKINASAPLGVTGFAPNRFDSASLNFFVGEESSLNGFKVTPLATADPLRVTISATADTIGGDFDMLVEGSYLYGKIRSAAFANGVYPTAGLTIDWDQRSDSAWRLGGVVLSGLKTSTLADTLRLQFQTSKFENNVLATGAVGSEPNIVVVKNGFGQSATITSTVKTKVGDVEFTNFVAKFQFDATPRKWNFTGGGLFFATPISDIGGANKPSVVIGGDAIKGYQLRLAGFPVSTTSGALPLPDTVLFNGVSFDLSTSKNLFQKVSSVGTTSVTYKLISSNNPYVTTVNIGRTAVRLTVTEFTITVTATGGEGKSITATIANGTTFTVGNATLTSTSLGFGFNPSAGTFQISGKGKFTFQAGVVDVVTDVDLGTLAAPGLVVKDGVIESLKLTVSGSFKMLGLDLRVVAPQTLTIEYVRSRQQFAMYGDMTLGSADQNGIKIFKDVKVKLGESAEKAGILIDGGALKNLDIVVSGDINLYEVYAHAKNVHVKYSSLTRLMEVGGEVQVTLTPGLILTSGLAFVIDTGTGRVQIKGLKLKSEGDVQFKAFTVKELEINYDDDGTKVTIGAGGILSLPSGLEVGGSFEIVNGKLNGISLTYGKNPGILLAGGLINIYSITGSVKGLQNPSEELEISAKVTASVGPAVNFAGATHSLAEVSGTITVTTKMLKLEGEVKLIGGFFGKGKFTGILDWSNVAKVTFDSTLELFPGGIIRGKISAAIDAKGNVDFNADTGVYVPRGVPGIGDNSLGTIKIGLRVRPELPKSESYVKFDVKFLIASGGVTARFDGLFNYRLGLDFGFFTATKTGRFVLRNLTAEPTVQILSAQAIAGTADGQIVVSSTTPLPASTTIELYADNDTEGNDGILIGSLPYQPGTQTFTWKNMAAFAKPGSPFFVYAVVNDKSDDQGYSNYSTALTTSPGFQPIVNSPLGLTFGPGQVVTFSPANGNAITVVDPRASSDPTSLMQVRLHVEGGILDLSNPTSTVTETGVGTDEIVLTGTAAEINAVLDGLVFEPDPYGLSTRHLKIAAQFLPLENFDNEVLASIDLKFQPLAMHVTGTEYADGSSVTVVPRGTTGLHPLQGVAVEDAATNFITGATIAIGNYSPGKDVLGFSVNDEIATGLNASFEPKTGVLTLTGFGRVDDYEDALRRITFFTTSTASAKTLSISLSDDYADHGSLSVPLTIVNGIAPPVIDVGQLGLKYTQGAAATPLAPNATITVPTGASVTGMTVEFTPGTYHAGEDLLSYSGAIPASFDAATGILTFTGAFSAAAYQQALRSVLYVDQGATFSAGLRDVVITVTDDAAANNTGDALVVIADDIASTPYTSPIVALSLNSVTMAADEEFIHLDPNLHITDDVTTLTGATVTITSGYVSGEDVLGVGELADGIRVSFDPAAGVLRLTGAASVEDYEFVLRSVILENLDRDRAAPRSLTLAVSVTDGLSSPSAPQAITATFAAAPFLDASLDNVVLYTHGQTTAAIDTGLKIDYPGTVTGATVAIAAGYYADEDQLVFTDQNGIHGVFDSVTGVLMLSGSATPQQYQTALESVRYSNSRFNPIVGDRIVHIRIFDGSIASNVVTAEINVEPDVVGPTITLVSAPQAFIENGAPVLVAAGIALAPPDATTPLDSWEPMLHGAEVDIPHYIAGEDILAFVNQGNITGRWDAVQGRLFLEGDDTLANYEAALRTVTYANLSEAPSATTRTLVIRLFESAGNGLSDSISTTVAVQSVVEPPVRTAGSIPGLTLLENQEAASLGLGSLQYAPASGVNVASVRLSFMPSHLPSEGLGVVTLADGTALVAGTAYALSELAGLRFLPSTRGHGSDTFTFDVVMADATTGNLDGGKLTQTVNLTMQGVSTTTASQAYLAQVYRDLYGVNPTATVLTQWANTLDAYLANSIPQAGVDTEKAARISVVSALVNTPTFRTHEIAWIYQHLLGRSPTASETTAALAHLAAGGTYANLRTTLAGSEEFYLAHSDGVHTGSDYVDALYLSLLGRHATYDEEKQWVANFKAGGTHSTIAQAIGNLPEAVQYAKDSLFVEYLHRHAGDADTSRFQSDTEEALVVELLSADEYYARYSTPSTAPYIPNQVTTAYTAVGKLGDAAGDKAGGTLIAPQYVLVAAHSVAGIPPGQLTFTIGGIVHHISAVSIHPEYDPHGLGAEGANDIAILKLDLPVTGITPAKLLNAAPAVGNVLKLVGFGAHNGTAYGIQRVGTTPPVIDVGPTLFAWRFDRLGDTDSTQGDSGSPVFVTVGGVDVVAGIVSGGTDPAAGLGDVATNTRVDAFLGWIQSKTGALNLVTLAAPVATIVGKPTLISKLKTGTFTFSGTLGGIPSSNLTFQVSLDGRAFVSIVGSTFKTPALADGPHTLTVRAVDADGNIGPASSAYSWTIETAPRLIALSRTNGSTSNFINWVDSTGATVWSIPVPTGFGSPTVASVTDRTGDGVADVVIGSQSGLSNLVGLVDGKTGDLLWSTNPFVSTFKGGVNVAVGDITGDTVPEVIVAPASAGGPNVRAFQQGNGSYAFTMIRDYYAYVASYTGGVNVAVADVNKDGVGDIITGTVKSSDNVRVFSAGVGTSMIADFFAFNRTGVIPGYAGGVSVAGADLNNDGYADIIAGTQTQYSRVRVYSGGANAGLANTPNALLMDYNTSTTKNGVLVMAMDFGGGKSGIGTLTDTGSSILLNTYGYSGTLAPTNLVSKAFTRPLSGAPPVRLG